MASNYIDDNLFWILMRVVWHAKHEVLQVGDEHGLTFMQTFALCFLEEGKTTAMNNLASFLHCDASNVTGIVDRLVTGGFIERRECERDRRIKTLQLTDKGTTIKRKILQKTEAPNIQTLSKLSEAEVQTLKTILKKTLAG